MSAMRGPSGHHALRSVPPRCRSSSLSSASQPGQGRSLRHLALGNFEHGCSRTFCTGRKTSRLKSLRAKMEYLRLIANAGSGHRIRLRNAPENWLGTWPLNWACLQAISRASPRRAVLNFLNQSAQLPSRTHSFNAGHAAPLRFPTTLSQPQTRGWSGNFGVHNKNEWVGGGVKREVPVQSENQEKGRYAMREVRTNKRAAVKATAQPGRAGQT